ncbi:MAG: hypothetical protein ACR2J4_00805, partial [Deinococcus sp.]
SLTVQVWGRPQTRRVSTSATLLIGSPPRLPPRTVISFQLPHGTSRQLDRAAPCSRLLLNRTLRDGDSLRADELTTGCPPSPDLFEAGRR